MSDEPAAPPKPSPLEVVIVAATAPIPVAATEPVPVVIAPDDRPSTYTGRPAGLGPNPTVAQLRQERAALRNSNAGRFSVEETLPKTPPPPPPHIPPDRTFTVLVMLICLNTAKLCLILWILLTVLQLRDQYNAADVARSAIITNLATVQRQVDQGVTQQQALINRVDDTLVRLQQQQPR